MFKRCLSSIVAFVLMCSFATGIPQQAMAVEFEPMVASDALVNVLKTMEGFSAKPYWDYAQWTVGYGTRCPDDKLEEYKKNGISKAAAEKLLKKELAKAENAVNNFAVENDRQFEQHEFDALISFTYNCGTGWTSETTGYFYNAVKSGDKGNDFLYAMALWSTAGGEFILIDRRMCEADMYINGIYNAPNAGEEKPYSDNFRWVFLDGNGGDVQYRIYAYDANDPVTLSSVSDKKMFSRKPMGEDKKGNALLIHWRAGIQKRVKKLQR